MKKIALAALATSLALAGCYQSKTLLLDIDQAVHPFADGTWIGDDEDKSTITIATYGSAYLLQEGDSHHDVILTPLAGHANTFAAAQADEGCASHPGDCEWEYAVVVNQDGKLREIAPNCEKDYPSVAAHVARHTTDSGDVCWFENADSLQKALGWVADNGKNQAITYSPEP